MPRPTNARVHMDAFAGRHWGPQHMIDESNDAKLVGERIRCALFASWLARNPNV